MNSIEVMSVARRARFAPKLRAVLRTVLACAAMLPATGDARASGGQAAPQQHVHTPRVTRRVGVPWYDETRSREWFVIGLGFLDRNQNDADAIDDALAWSLDGGYELWREPLRISLELGATYSPHHIDLPDAETLDLWRLSMGARVTWPSDVVRPYLRGGFFYRWNSDDEYEDEPFDQNGMGWYAGVGLDFPYLDGMTLGPFYTRYEGTDDELEEQLFGLCAGFRL